MESPGIENRPQKIRVLHLGSPTGLYGAERWILALINYLPSELIDSTVGVIQDDPNLGEAALCSRASETGVKVVQFDAYGKLSFSAISQLKRYIKTNDIDVLHTHGYKTDIIGVLATIGTNCRTVSTPHGWSIDAGLKLQFYEALDRISFYFMDAVVPLSADIYDGLAKRLWQHSNLTLVPNAVDLGEIDKVSACVEHPADGIQHNGVVLGYIGQLIDRKRIDSLIAAFDTLDIPEKHLWIIGEGPQRASLESLARKSPSAKDIHFLGFREDRLALLKRLDVFVLPSSLEGIPRCVMEAMAAEIPVVVSDIPGCTDLVDHGVTGLLFECGNVSQLADSVIRILRDDRLRAVLAQNGRELVRNQYSAERMAEDYVSIYSRFTRFSRVAEKSSGSIE